MNLYEKRIEQGFHPSVAACNPLLTAQDKAEAKKHGISIDAMYQRLRRGMTKYEAITTPKVRPTPPKAPPEAQYFTRDETVWMIRRFKRFNIKLNDLLLRRAKEYQINIEEVK
ncbi:hypothetical protein [Salinicoccus albus]|uniref:hypothetical protein n=1 Tax=Salinicoccus albus TaxID=418756 RepID=UPI00035CA021|nr:hypothetical protein [Salinicoccus albus]